MNLKSDRLPAKYCNVMLTDENGEVLYDRTTLIGRRNGSGFVVSYTSRVCDFLEKVPAGSIVRVFFYIAHHQNYGTDNVYGFRCSRSYFGKVLRLSRKTVYSALEYLKKNRYIVENRINGSLEFMVNPNVVTIGSDKKGRIAEFRRRCDSLINEQLPDIYKNPDHLEEWDNDD